jgi:hemerythrin
MSLLQWRDEFAIGIPAVDFEHQELIALINELHDDLTRSGPEARTREFLGELYARIAAHFALEERVMREIGYDQYADHKGDHEVLLDELTDIMDAVGEDPTGMEDRLASALDTWFSEHFKTRDARLHKSLG